MMISATEVGKKFYQRWIFRNIGFELSAGERLALTGSNGSGKSTLLRIIAGQLKASSGKLQLSHNSQVIPIDQLYRYVSWSAPYIDLYPDLSLKEHFQLHFRFKPCILSGIQEAFQLLKLEAHADKPLRIFSSGMLQRAKVGMALFTDTPLLLLDEPTSNMDAGNASMMLNLITQYQGDRILILASNMDREFGEITKRIALRS